MYKQRGAAHGADMEGDEPGFLLGSLGMEAVSHELLWLLSLSGKDLVMRVPQCPGVCFC